jgi:hypothetical protein
VHELSIAVLMFIPNLLKNLVKSAKFKQVFGETKKVAAVLQTLAPYALEAMNLVALTSGGRSPAELLQVATNFKLDMTGITIHPELAISNVTVKGLLLSAAGEALRANLTMAIAETGGAGLKLADNFFLKHVDGLSGSLIDTACQMAYGLVVNAGGTPSLPGRTLRES